MFDYSGNGMLSHYFGYLLSTTSMHVAERLHAFPTGSGIEIEGCTGADSGNPAVWGECHQRVTHFWHPSRLQQLGVLTKVVSNWRRNGEQGLQFPI